MPRLGSADAVHLSTLGCSVTITLTHLHFPTTVRRWNLGLLVSCSCRDRILDGSFDKAVLCVCMIRRSRCFRVRARECCAIQHCVCPKTSHLCGEQPGYLFWQFIF